MTLRMDEELDRALTALAAVEGITRQEIIRRAVLDRYRRTARTAQVQDSFNRMIDKWADALGRLGTV